MSGRESIFAWIENWLRDKKERVGINGCFFKWRTRVPQELVLSLVLCNTQGTSIECPMCAFPAVSTGGITHPNQTQLPSWRSPEKEVLSDTSKFSEDRQLWRGRNAKTLEINQKRVARKGERAPSSKQKIWALGPICYSFAVWHWARSFPLWVPVFPPVQGKHWTRCLVRVWCSGWWIRISNRTWLWESLYFLWPKCLLLCLYWDGGPLSFCLSYLCTVRMRQRAMRSVMPGRRAQPGIPQWHSFRVTQRHK